MLPNRCSMAENGKQCPNPPEFIVTITSNDGNDEYMLGVTCNRHKQDAFAEVFKLQKGDEAALGRIGFTPIRPVGTDCIRSDPDELVQLSSTCTAAATPHPRQGRCHSTQ